MRIACWIPKAADTHSGYVTLTAFLLQQWLKESASMLRHTYTDCLVQCREGATIVAVLRIYKKKK
jgi:hypothetical protein